MIKNKKYSSAILLLLIFLVVFISAAAIKTPIKQTFEYNPDEGFASIRSALLLKGFRLYTEIHTDQPPLYIVIQSYWFKLFGPSLYHGRILILIFSCVFLWAFYQAIKNPGGQFCSFMAVIFLLLSTLYLRLGISIMIGTVSLSLAMLSIYFITLYKKSYAKYHLVLSGIFLALSLQVKLVTAFLIPLIVFEIIQAKWTQLGDKRKPILFFRPLLLWFGALLAVALVFIAIFLHFNLSLITQQLIQPHLRKITVPGCDFFIIWKLILSDYDIALLALIGIILLIKQKKWQLFFPVLWLGAALTVLALYKPVWEHYYPLVSIPICWLAAISVSQFFFERPKMGIFFRWLTAAIIILAILKIPGKYNRMSQSIRVETAPEERQAVELLLKHKKDIRWIFTNRSTFAFNAGILVPPELAIVTKKSDFTSKTGQIYLINKLKEYRPEVIIFQPLVNSLIAPSAVAYIKDNYTLLYKLTPHYHNTGKTNTLSLEMKLFNKAANYFSKLREDLYRVEFFRPKPDYKYFYRLLTKELQDKAGYFLAETLEELITSAPQPITKEGLDANPILPFTLSEDGKFRLKPYAEVSKRWEEKLQDQPVSFFAYQFFKKILKIWEAEQGKNAVSAPTISRLQSLWERILRDIEERQIISSFNPQEFRNPLTFRPQQSHKDIEFYIRKDILKPTDSVSR